MEEQLQVAGPPCGDQEPIVFHWDGGEALLGYLGGLRWRVRIAGECVDGGDVVSAVTLVFETIFRGVQVGTEAAARSPLDLAIDRDRMRFLAEPKFTNGWRCSSPRSDATVGDHPLLLPFIAERLARAADDVWATGISEVHPPPLASRFSFEAFAHAANPDELCGELEAALNERLRTHPSPAAAFELAMQELKAAGHDLWSWTPEEVWGPDYVEVRPGAGLQVTRHTDEDEAVENTVTVQFAPRRR